MPVEYLTPSIEDGTVAVQAALTDRSQQQAASIPDLLLGATAELHSSSSSTSSTGTLSG